jgi:rod shape-determining protein MreC
VLGLVLLAGALLLADLRFSGLATLRAGIDTALTPVYLIAGIPSALGQLAGSSTLRSRQPLPRRQRAAAPGEPRAPGSARSSWPRYRPTTHALRALLNSTALLRDDVLVSEIIGVSPDPVRHQLILDKGDGGPGVRRAGADRRQWPDGPGGRDQRRRRRACC